MEPTAPSTIHQLRTTIHRNTDLIDDLPLLQAIKDLQDTWFARQEALAVPAPLRARPRKRAPHAGMVAAVAALLPFAPVLLSL